MGPKERDLKREIKEGRLKKQGDPMWFYDEPEELLQAFRKETLPVEKEYLELRVLLRDTEATLRDNPDDEYLKARVKYLKKRVEELEKKAPWISTDVPFEVLLWGVPHG